jgi:hypothetical protein
MMRSVNSSYKLLQAGSSLLQAYELLDQDLSTAPQTKPEHNGIQVDQGIARKAQQESEGEMEGTETTAAAEAP